ncbi:unnamed protein product, partial [Rotaria sp. Silwood2]
MTTKTNLKRIREIITTNTIDEFDTNIFEDDESNSDSDYLSETESESHDTSTDECISKEDESCDPNVSDDIIHLDINAQPETIEKDGLLWSTQKSTAPGRLRATNVMKKKPSSVTAVQTIIETFKLFITNEIPNEIL